MIVSNIKVKMQNDFLVGRCRGKYMGQIPAPNLKRGYRSFTLCADGTDQFFNIPEDATDIRMIATKRAHPGAYKVEKSTSIFGNVYFTFDGFGVPGMYENAQYTLKQLLRDGYCYVRFDYKQEG